jgi:hypothetical protein
MAVVFIQEFPISDRSTANYDFVKEQLGDGPFDGLIAHTAGFDDDGGVFRIMDVWESREQAERFLAEKIQPLVEQGPQAFPNPDAFTPPTRETYYELHDVLSGARAPAQAISS